MNRTIVILVACLSLIGFGLSYAQDQAKVEEDWIKKLKGHFVCEDIGFVETWAVEDRFAFFHDSTRKRISCGSAGTAADGRPIAQCPPPVWKANGCQAKYRKYLSDGRVEISEKMAWTYANSRVCSPGLKCDLSGKLENGVWIFVNLAVPDQADMQVKFSPSGIARFTMSKKGEPLSTTTFRGEVFNFLYP